MKIDPYCLILARCVRSCRLGLLLGASLLILGPSPIVLAQHHNCTHAHGTSWDDLAHLDDLTYNLKDVSAEKVRAKLEDLTASLKKVNVAHAPKEIRQNLVAEFLLSDLADTRKRLEKADKLSDEDLLTMVKSIHPLTAALMKEMGMGHHHDHGDHKDGHEHDGEKHHEPSADGQDHKEDDHHH